ncbi:TIGR01244 family phosphatase [Rhodomicrobium vannielii ATCC 17100]|uniref:TIGR01244 family sulfur transferase n=1 Tax=Rhodomicrobium vannielii TaxID=1069 RepID=UPI00191AF351|nr:TIGR01244 family phosphatase [Rhodomicrobium vannielii ATCC 17100]
MICEACLGIYLLTTATQPDLARPSDVHFVAEKSASIPARPLTKTLSVAPQIRLDDIPAYAAQGITTIISNRPDGEAPDQPTFAEIKKAAEANGMKAIHIPIASPSAITDADAAAFGKALDESKGKTLAFCRSGTRATLLWSLSQAGRRSAQDIVQTAAEAGYDVSPILMRLEK